MSWKRPAVEQRMAVFLEDLPSTISGNILDMGTGDGVFTRLLKTRYPNNFLLQMDIQHYRRQGNEFYQGAIQAPPHRLQSLSLIVCAQVLHYLGPTQQKQAISALLSVLEPQGRLVIIEYINQTSRPWLPFPLLVDDLEDMGFSPFIRRIIYDQDKWRPKYAAYLSGESMQ